MPCDLYRIRLIHSHTRKVLPGERIWSAVQLAHGARVRFLRLCNREGHDVYLQPFAGDHNAGYILVDLDRAEVDIIDTMRANGHRPCVVIETSPGHLQAWVRVSVTPLEPAVATAIGRQLARAYGGDRASIDWRHLGHQSETHTRTSIQRLRSVDKTPPRPDRVRGCTARSKVR